MQNLSINCLNNTLKVLFFVDLTLAISKLLLIFAYFDWDISLIKYFFRIYPKKINFKENFHNSSLNLQGCGHLNGGNLRMFSKFQLFALLY